MIKIITIFFFFSALSLSAQFNFEYAPSIVVKNGPDTLDLAWAGGLSYAQFSDFDYDFDGDLDLFVFDRSSDVIKVFTQEIVNGQKKYRLQYNAHLNFPADIRYRATLVDYNNDGKKDIFCYGIGGIKVYKNIGNAVSGLQWELAKNLLYSDYGGTLLNLYVSSSDIPAIVDVDFDGDLDILTFHIGGEHLQYHKNMSVETYGHADSLNYVLKNECWGGFREDINTNSLFLNDNSSPCTTGNVPGAQLHPLDELEKRPTEQTPKHSGSTVLALDYDNSGVLDLIIGDVSFPNLNLLINGGTSPNTNSKMISVDSNFPSNSFPVNMNVFPASFFLDVDFDGKKDLIVGANARNISQNESSVYFYKNFGGNSNPTFVYQTSAFLQNKMIEHGTGSIPVLFDYNQDGLQDLFVANFFSYIPTLNKTSRIAYYKNTGTPTNPVFTFIDNDFLNLGSSGFGLRIFPAFGDVDGDGDQDMFLGLENGTLVYYKNTSVAPAISFASPQVNYTDNLGNVISAGQYAAPQLFDLNKDGLLDLIIGKKTGEIIYYQNVGTSSSPSFELKNNLLGNIDVATDSPEGYAIPHFFSINDTTHLFLGSISGKLQYFKDIDGNLNSGASFTLVSDNYLTINTGAYSSFYVNDIDQDGFLNMFVGQDLGGIMHFEADPNSQVSIISMELDNQLKIYPNPSTGVFVLLNETNLPLNYQILNLIGNVVQENRQFSGKEIVDLSNSPNGIYLVESINAKGERKIYRLVIQHP